MPIPQVCVFDVNETLLDLAALDSHFERIFGDAGARRLWFSQLLQSALVTSVLKDYTDFGRIGGAALSMIASRQGIVLSDGDLQIIVGAVTELPPHRDVQDGLERLRSAGVRLAALTNSSAEIAEAQITHAGLRDYFEQVLSADAVHRLKPAPEPYRMAAKCMGTDVGGLMLVAAHDWDVAGAMRVGCAAAFVARPGMVLNPLFETPEIIGIDLIEVAEQILERAARSST